MGTPSDVPVAPRTSGLAIASLVLGILGLFSAGVLAVVGLVLGIVGLVQINASRGMLRGRNLAIGGIAVSGCMIMLIPIMAAMLFPVFARAREHSKQVECMSNLRQIGLAMAMYSEDYNGRWPLGDGWCDALEGEYIRSEDTFQCPSLPGVRAGYAYNAQLSGARGIDVAFPAKTVAVFDAKGGWNVAGGAELAELRHKGRLNVGFVSGDVQLLSTDDLESMIWEPGDSTD